MTTDEKDVFIRIQNSIVCSKALVLLNCLNKSIWFPQYRSYDDTQESIFFQSWTFSCSHVVFLMNTTKDQNLQGFVTRSVLGKQNRQANEV